MQEGVFFELFLSPEKGIGVRAGCDIYPGTRLLQYRGELLIGREQILAKEASHSDEVGCYMFWFKHKDRQYCLDATEAPWHQFKARYINHSRRAANLKTILMCDEQTHLLPQLWFVALRFIRAGEELLFDYGDRRREIVFSNPWLME